MRALHLRILLWRPTSSLRHEALNAGWANECDCAAMTSSSSTSRWRPTPSASYDRVRSAASAGLAAAEGPLSINLKEACAAVLNGSTTALRAGGKPMVLAENDRWLRKLATGRLRDPVEFWGRMGELPTARGPVSNKVHELLLQRLPDGSNRVRFTRLRAGLGSLGLERLVAIAEWDGSFLAHEANAAHSSSCE